MVKTPSYTHNNNNSGTETLNWKLCVCMASNSQPLKDCATYVRRNLTLWQFQRRIDVPLIHCRTFPLWRRRCLTTTNRFNNCFIDIEDGPTNFAFLGRGGPLALPPGITDWLREWAWRPAWRMGRMKRVVASDYEGVKEAARCEKGDRGGHMA